ncbi:MAG: DNA polymerase III subunit gamma/tau [bacterium]|nr:DNA polymerase III subunit gamma/tau [bacterium]
MSLYRKYRPQTFADIEGQEHVVQTLQGALASGRVGHAYFFAGPRGTGKTTMARLIAKALNCTNRKEEEPCNKCYSCTEINAGKSLDLIEIDAASHTGVDNIRSVIDSAQTAAATGTYKTFIIDEVHMLSKSSFNALLKTLEEPPAHTMFVLATTEPHKVPETILSRVQRLDFHKLNREQIVEKLERVAKAEKLTIDDGALELLVTAASGSLRDAESALAKVMAFAGTKITTAQTSAILGVIPAETHAKLLETIHQKQGSEAIAQLTQLHDDGVNLDHFAKQFIEYVRGVLIEAITKNNHDPKFLVNVITRFLEARSASKYSPIPQLPLELAVIDLTRET